MTAALAIASGTIGAVPVRVGVPVRLWTALGALAIALALLVVPTPRPALGIVVAPHDYPGGGMIGFGSVDLDPPDMPEPVNSPVFAGVASPDGQGYLLASADGGVFAFGDATYEGSLGNLALNGPVVAMAATPTGKGYWLGAIDGGIFAFGDAKFYGSVPGVLKPGQSLNQPIVGMAATPDGMGYWLVAADGGIFSFGDARFYGSTGGIKLDQPIVGMAATPDGKGYWLVAADGGIFSFGDAKFHGSEANAQLPDPVVGMIASPDGHAHLGHCGQREGQRVLAARSRCLDLQLHLQFPRRIVPRVFDHRLVGGLAGSTGSRHRVLLQSVRALRGVVCPVRHLGLAAGRCPHPVLRVHGGHVRLGGAARQGAGTDGHARPG
jgi:hypothetical protein